MPDHPKIGEILSRLADGEGLRAICRSPGMPTASCVIKWTMQDDEFRKQYADARARGYELMADELVEISDDNRNDTSVDDEGNERTNHDVIARSRLMVDTRKWILAKMLPKVYGEKITQEHTGADGAALPGITVSFVQPDSQKQSKPD